MAKAKAPKCPECGGKGKIVMIVSCGSPRRKMDCPKCTPQRKA
jgi:RecJ-like exonuclease